MFTGIVTDIGRIEAVEARGDLRVRIACPFDTGGVALGASIACSGICLTVIDKGEGWFAVDVSAETQARTAAGMWTEGRRLNLERSLRVGDELGGHIVSGHVDGVGTVESVHGVGDSQAVRIALDPALAPFVAAKGSISLDGVSLTVNEIAGEKGGTVHFTVNLIPHTAAVTTLDDIAPGRQLNVEIDILARYLGRMLDARS